MKLSEYTIQDNLETELISFIRQYGLTGLKEAMQLYAEASQDYICKTKTSVYKIKIKDIYYLKIRGHHITVHTENGIYRKYGTLHQEFSLLSPYGFLKCSQTAYQPDLYRQNPDLLPPFIRCFTSRKTLKKRFLFMYENCI